MTKQTYLILGIVIILLIAGALFAWERREGTVTPPVIEPAPVTPVTPTPPTVAPPTTPIVPTPQTPQTPAGWKTYENKEFGFEISYPGEWFVYDAVKLENDEKIAPCVGLEPIDTLVLSKQNLGRCVGPSGDSMLIGDFSIYIFSDTENLDDISKTSGSGSKTEMVHIAGEPALKSYFTKRSVLPRDFSVNIYLNYGNKGYMIIFPQIDLQYHYNPVYDQILSTFRFLK